MSEQTNAAAERSAHVERGPRRIPGESFLVEVSPGVFQIKALAEARAEIERLRAALHLISYAEVEARVAAARRGALEEAASLIECGCKNRHDVVMQRPNSAARWSLCEHPNCMMIEAAAIRALLTESAQ